MLMSVTVAPELLVALHGKSLPSAARGLLLGVPYGGGEPRIIWALLVATKRAVAEKERRDMIEDILRLKIAVMLRSRRRAIVEFAFLRSWWNVWQKGEEEVRDL